MLVNLVQNRGNKAMGYYIYAWLDDGNPQLKIVDVQSKSICMRWSYQHSDDNSLTDKKEIQRLFKDLLLLTCRQEMKNSRLFQVSPLHNQLNDPQILDKTGQKC